MSVPVDVLGQLSLEDDAGNAITVVGDGASITLDLPSFSAARPLAGYIRGRSRRSHLIDALQGTLQRAGLLLRIQVAGRPIAALAPQSRATLLSRLLGLGALQLKPLAILVAAIRR